MRARILVLYYSMFGNTYALASAVCEGIQAAGGVPVLRRVPEIIPRETADADERIRAGREAQKGVPVATLRDLDGIDGMALGSPTRFGNMCAQLRNFLDQTGGLWMKGALIGKPAGVFCCTATLHGGQETTLVSMMLTLLHHGMIVLGVPYSLPELTTTTGGGTPYGPTAVVGPAGDTPPTDVDRAIARELGRRLTECAGRLAA